MNITRDVITDLLPLYLAGEASPGTRALLEDYLREHPEFASTVREATERGAALLESTPSNPLAYDREKATLERVRRFNQRRILLLALTFGVVLTILAVGFERLLLRGMPGLPLLVLVASFGCLAAYVSMGGRLRMRGR